jgi:lysophospholipase L1-like esterase
MRNRIRTKLFWLLLIIGVAAIFTGIDFLFGYFRAISTLRVSAQQFRSEAARLPIRTLNLVPNTNHSYHSPYRGDLGTDVLPGTPRVFRTDRHGRIITGNATRTDAAPKILFLGGSTTESNEVDESFRFPTVVERLLNDRYSVPVEVWNGGVRGHTTVDSINLLLNRSEYSHATHVVLMHNINDRLLLAFQDGYQSPLALSGETSWRKVKEACNTLVTSIWDFSSYHSNLLFVARMQFAKFHPFTGERVVPVVSEDTIDLEDSKLEQHIRTYKTYVEAFIAVAKATNRIPLLMTQPLGRPSNGQTKFNEALREVAYAQHVSLIDLDNLLPDDREWLFLGDLIHMNNEGGKALGNIIAGELSEGLGSKIKKEHYQPLVPFNVSDLRSRCLSPPEEGLPHAGNRHLLLGLSGRYPSFAPDGEKMVLQKVIRGREQIQLYDFASHKYTILSEQNANYSDRHPAIIEQGKGGSLEIAFGSDRAGAENVYILKWPRLEVRKMLNVNSIRGAIPTKGPDKSVVFAGFDFLDEELVNPDLFVFGTSGLKRLTRTKHQEWKPVLSPDGKYVYYIADPKGDLDIYRLAIEEPQPELVYRTSADEWDPAISPDGRWLVFASKHSGNWDLYLIDLTNDNGVTQITSGPEDDWDPSFYPDGKILVFASVNGDGPRIFGMCLFGEK